MAKLTSKFVRVSTSIDAKVLEDGKIKRAGATVVGKSYSTVIKSLNGLGAAFTSQASVLTSISLSLQKSVDTTTKLQESFDKLSEAKDETAETLTAQSTSKPSSPDKKTPSPMERAMTKDVDKKSKPFFSGIGKLLGFLKGFIGKLFVFAVVQSVLKWVGDPKNAKKVGDIVKGLSTVFGFLFDVVKGVTGLVVGGIVNLGSGLQKIFGSGGDPKKILSGFADVITSIPGLFVLGWLANPAGMFKAIIKILTSWKEPRQKEPDPPEKPKKPDSEKPKKPKTPDTPPRRRGPFSGVGDRVRGLGDKFTDLGKRAAGAGSRLLDQGKKTFGGIVDFLGENWKKLSNAYKNTVGKLQEFGQGLIKKGQAAVLDWLSKQGGIIGKVGKALPDLLKKLGKYLPFVGDVLGFVMDISSGIDWRRALLRAVIGASIDAGFTALMGALGLATPFTGGASGIAATALYVAYMGADLAVGGLGKVIGDPIADALGIPMKAGESSESAKVGTAPSEEQALKQTQDAISKKDPDYAKKIAEKEAKKRGNTAEDGGVLTPDGKQEQVSGPVTTRTKNIWIDLLGTGGMSVSKGSGKTVRGLLSQAIYWQYLFADATLELKKKGIFQRGIEGIANAIASTGEKLSAGLQRISTFGGNVLAKLGIGTGEYGEAPLKKAAEAAGIKGKELAAFLAQMSHESGGFNYKEEISGGKDSYDGGKRYKGRGYIQLTHRYNYAKYGKEFGVDLVKNPDLAKDGELAAKIAVSYWMRNVRPTVNGDWDNVFLHSKAINYPAATRKSQVNGMEDREKRYAAYLKKLGLDKKADGGILRRESLPSVRVGFSVAKTVKDEEKPKLFAGGGSLPAGAHRLIPNDPSSSWAAGIPLTRVSAASGQKAEVALPLAKRFQGFIKDLEGTGYKIDQLGGWRLDGPPGGNKDGKGPLYSHPYGAAIDINWNRNPAFRKAGNDFPAGIKSIAGKHGLGWGNAFDDAMHFSAMKREYGAGIDGQEISKKSLMGSKGGDGFTPSDTGTASNAPPATGSQSTQLQQEAELSPEQALAAALEKLVSASTAAGSAFGSMDSPSSPMVPSKAPERSSGGAFKPIVEDMDRFGGIMSDIGNISYMLTTLSPEQQRTELPLKTEQLSTAIQTAASAYNVLNINLKTELIMKDSYVVTEKPQAVKTVVLNNTMKSTQQIITGNNAYGVVSPSKPTNFFS